MKNRYGILVTVVIFGITGVFLSGCKHPLPPNTEGPPTVPGFNEELKLVAEYKPAHLYIYADTASTNKHPDYVIFQRFDPIVIANNESNIIEVVLSENDFKGSLTTKYDSNGRILKRIFGVDNGTSETTNYMYFDTNGDGLWDGFIINSSNSIKSYSRSNLSWVPRFPDQN